MSESAPTDAAKPDPLPAPKPSLLARAKGWALDLLFVAAVVLAVSWWQTRDLVETGEPLPDVVLQNLDGTTFSTAELRGKTVHLFVWATWCGVCKTEFGALNARAGSLGSDEVLIAVALDSGSLADVQQFLSTRDVQFRVAVGSEAVNEALRVSLFPTSYYVDRNGKIARTSAGRETRLGMAWRMWLAGRAERESARLSIDMVPGPSRWRVQRTLDRWDPSHDLFWNLAGRAECRSMT